MATATPPLPPMPSQDVPVIDQNGRMNVDWYRYLKMLETIVRGLRTEV